MVIWLLSTLAYLGVGVLAVAVMIRKEIDLTWDGMFESDEGATIVNVLLWPLVALWLSLRFFGGKVFQFVRLVNRLIERKPEPPVLKRTPFEDDPGWKPPADGSRP